MAEESQGHRGLNFEEFKLRLLGERFVKGQQAPLQMRLRLLESFLEKEPSTPYGKRPVSSKEPEDDVWDFKRGSLTIVDLSCPFVDESDACALFNICLGIFLEGRSK